MIDQFSIIPHLNKSDQEWAEFVASSTFDDVCTAWLHAWTFHSLVFLADLVKQPYRCMHFLGFTTALQYINLTKVAPCCICGRGFSIGEITSAVTAGVGKNHEQLTAHKACWENKAK